MSTIAENILRVQEQIADAAQQAGRRPEEITLVAVTKKKPASAIVEALAAGITDVGENYVQEAAEKRASITNGRWHLMGHLQSNKAKLAVSLFDLIQSVDSVKLAAEIGKQSAEKPQEILLQVHLGDEETKTGFAPNITLDVAAEIAAIINVSLCGLMGIAPNGVDPRPYFQQLKQLFDQLPPENRQILSMGMSGDFVAAIQEGATMVRVGTAIFGARDS
ncbi:MAG: YggS family pyridoxal phosphate-dependent enzyme [Janthinobacterium lividum]